VQAAGCNKVTLPERSVNRLGLKKTLKLAPPFLYDLQHFMGYLAVTT
jgi:hypothetical protein